MLILLTNNRNNEFKFSQYCKENNFDFVIIEKVVELFYYADKVKKGFTIIDWNEINFKDLLMDLKSSSNILNNSVVINHYQVANFQNVDNLDNALAVAKYEFLNNNKFLRFDSLDIEVACENILEEYGFQVKYEGYRYLKSICIHQALNSNLKFNYRNIVNEISHYYGVDNILLIERNLRYIVEINKNAEIMKIKGDTNRVPVKAVIAFLLDKLGKRMAMKL
ncbi:MAG: hypothetical protein IJZ29_05720 [Clostridia bacterium]|nr:hypothetical protein [Clostridia bacterium]